MRSKVLAGVTCGVMAIVLTTMGPAARAQGQQGASAATPANVDDDPVRALVGRLDLEKYKATIKGLTQFGDRRQGTDRNRAAIDWIEAQLKSYGCTNTERIKYDYQPAAGRGGTGREGAGAQAGEGRGTGRGRGEGAATGTGQRQGGGRGRGGQGGSTIFGTRGPTGVNNDPEKQPDAKLRELNRQPTTPGPRDHGGLCLDPHR